MAEKVEFLLGEQALLRVRREAEGPQGCHNALTLGEVVLQITAAVDADVIEEGYAARPLQGAERCVNRALELLRAVVSPIGRAVKRSSLCRPVMKAVLSLADIASGREKKADWRSILEIQVAPEILLIVSSTNGIG